MIRTAAAGGKDPDPNGFERTEASADEIVNAKKEKRSQRSGTDAGFRQPGTGRTLYIIYRARPSQIPMKEANIC